MKITFLGTGTSQGIPVICCTCAACLSADTKDQRLRSAIQIEVENQTIVIDIGPDFRQQMLRAKTHQIAAILLTHGHNDHIAGLDDIRPYNFFYKMDMPLYGQKNVLDFLKQRHPYIFAATYPGVPRVLLHTIDKNTPFEVASIPIIPIEIYHGRLPILAYRIANFAYLTDFKTIADSELLKLKGLDILVVSALQEEPHHSHSSLSESIAFAQKVGAKKTYFTHLSHKMGTHGETVLKLPPNIYIAYDGLEINC